MWGISISTTVVGATQITYFCNNADNSSNVYDLGLYSSSGSLAAHIGGTAGTTFCPSNGGKTLSLAATSSFQAGRYYLAYTTNCSTGCATLGGDSASGFTFYKNESGFGTTSSGVLPSSITPPADSISGSATIPALELH
jgi:hypothetical protein